MLTNAKANRERKAALFLSPKYLNYCPWTRKKRSFCLMIAEKFQTILTLMVIQEQNHPRKDVTEYLQIKGSLNMFFLCAVGILG